MKRTVRKGSIFAAVLVAVVIVFLSAVPVVFAVDSSVLESGIVPNCDASDQPGVGFSGACQLCDLVKLADNMVRFMVAFSVIVATLMFAYAGALYFTAASNPENIKKAHSVFVKVVVGLVLILIAWLLVDIIMKTLAGNQFSGPWKEIQCVPYPNNGGEDLAPAELLPPSREGGSGGGNGTVSVQCGGCEDVTVFSVKSGVNAGAAPDLHAKLDAFHTALGSSASTLQITEGWPPRSSAHVTASQHNNGTAVDMGFKNNSNYTTENVVRVIQAANTAGVGLTYEVPYLEGTSQCRSAVAPFASSGLSGQVSCNSDATAPHFHVHSP